MLLYPEDDRVVVNLPVPATVIVSRLVGGKPPAYNFSFTIG